VLIAGAGLDDDHLIVDRAQRAGDLALGGDHGDRIAQVAGEQLGRRRRAGHEALLGDERACVGQVVQLHRGRIDRRGDAGQPGLPADDLDVALFGDHRAGRGRVAAVGDPAVGAVARWRRRRPHGDLRPRGAAGAGLCPVRGDLGDLGERGEHA